MRQAIIGVLSVLGVMLTLAGCDSGPRSSDQIQQEAQESILAEGTAKTGMPSITEFRERKLLRDILEKRDKASYTTYTYFGSDITGKVGDKLCDSIGYPLPYATQYTNPQKMQRFVIGGAAHYQVLPQADPNGLFSPNSADATWVLCKNPNGKDLGAVYVEPKVIASPFPLK